LVSKDEKYAYLSTTDGLKIFDISNPLHPQQIAIHEDDRLKNITQAYLSENEEMYIAVNTTGKKITPVKISSLNNIEVGSEVTYFSDATDDNIVSMQFVAEDKKLYVLSQKTIGYYNIDGIESLTLERRLGGLSQYIEAFKGFAVSNNEQVYLIGEGSNKLLILDMPRLTLTGYFNVSGSNAHNIILSNNDSRLTLYDDFGILLLDIADDNGISLAGYDAFEPIAHNHSSLSTYGKTFLVSTASELRTYTINADNSISESYAIAYPNAAPASKVLSKSGHRLYTQNGQGINIYDYSLFSQYHSVKQPVLLSPFAEYTNQNSVTLKLVGDRNDNILINGQPVGETINAFFANDVHHTLQDDDGLNTLNIQFERDGVLSEPLVLSITKDTIAPEVIDFTPSDKSLLLADDLAITLNYQDNIGMDLSRSAIYLDNEEIDRRALKENSFTYLLNLEDKRYKITAKLFDFAGNHVEKEYTFVINTQKPKVSASVPGANYSYAFDVELTTDENSVIYYTTDGSTPTESSLSYSQAINITATTTLKYFAKNTVSAKTSDVYTQQYDLDLSGPQVITGYPANGQTFNANDEFRYTFSSSNAISNITIIDKLGADLSAYTHVDGNRVSFDISLDQNRLYELTIIATDDQGNSTSIPLEFWVDTVAPITLASVGSGEFSETISVDLISNEENANIYYSIDGTPPMIGAANTVEGGSSVRNISIDNTSNLQFFAVDAVGNREATNTEVYYFGQLLDHNVAVTAIYQSASQQVALSWPSGANATSYQIYRVDNIIDQQILLDSINASYLAPKKYLLATTSSAAYTDNTVESGAKYYYAVSKVIDSIETTVSDIVAVEINNTSTIQTTEESIKRATNYLKKSQNPDGSWSNATGKFSMLHTSQVLDALFGNSDNAYTKDLALYYLKGRHVKNNDFLARKVNSLSRYGLITDSLINKLVSFGEFTIANGFITQTGWGAYPGFKFSAYETALAIKALDNMTTSNRSGKFNQLKQYNPLVIYNVTQWNWQRDSYFASSANVYVSALSYSVSNNSNINTWLNQNADGSFGEGLLDTAAVLLYMNLTGDAKTQAINYLISQQHTDGNFGDISTTALCLEALSKESL
jgi:hypothetical protein